MTASALKIRLVTVEDFLAWVPEDDRRYELINGEIVAAAAPKPAHSRLQGGLARHIGNALAGTECVVLTEVGIRPEFDPAHNFRVADLAVTCEPYDPTEPYTRLPILLVEILSPTEMASQRSKLHVYAAMPSVREILLVDSRVIRAELHRRGSGGRWPEQPEIIVGDETLRLETVGLELPLSACYAGLGLPAGER